MRQWSVHSLEMWEEHLQVLGGLLGQRLHRSDLRSRELHRSLELREWPVHSVEMWEEHLQVLGGLLGQRLHRSDLRSRELHRSLELREWPMHSNNLGQLLQEHCLSGRQPMQER